MTRNSAGCRLFAIVALLLALPAGAAQAAEALASWNDGPAKRQIVGFVAKVTDKRGKDYVAPADRIAVFDNDGTLWSEQPVYFQLAFALDRVKALAPSRPHWATTQPFKAALEGDVATLAAGGERALAELVTGTPRHRGADGRAPHRGAHAGGARRPLTVTQPRRAFC